MMCSAVGCCCAASSTKRGSSYTSFMQDAIMCAGVQDGTLRECQKLLELEAHGGRGASEGQDYRAQQHGARRADACHMTVDTCTRKEYYRLCNAQKEAQEQSRSSGSSSGGSALVVHTAAQLPNPYKLLVLNLILAEEPGRTQSLMRTVEDYMWFKLHFCHAHASVAYKAHRASSSSSSSQQQQQPVAVFTLKHLQAEVTNKYGPAHFDKQYAATVAAVGTNRATTTATAISATVLSATTAIISTTAGAASFHSVTAYTSLYGTQVMVLLLMPTPQVLFHGAVLAVSKPSEIVVIAISDTHSCMRCLWSDAVRYLRRAGQIVPAVHLAIALGYSGVLDGCHGAGNSTAASVTNSIPEYLPEEEAIVKYNNNANAIDVGSTLLRAMVTNYAQRLQSTNPDVATHYLYRLVDQHTEFEDGILEFKRAAAKLLLETRDYGTLVGELSSSGRRVRSSISSTSSSSLVRTHAQKAGTLDELLPEEEHPRRHSLNNLQCCINVYYADTMQSRTIQVNDVILMAAEQAEHRSMYNDALTLYALAGKFVAVLRLLNAQLAEYLPLLLLALQHYSSTGTTWYTSLAVVQATVSLCCNTTLALHTVHAVLSNNERRCIQSATVAGGTVLLPDASNRGQITALAQQIFETHIQSSNSSSGTSSYFEHQ
eukprot:21186-Heterococcus_DN1.PRE.3